ncbi:MAG: hypothetical protein J5863_04810, partial [Desulfovibrio sp.]|nr:hypothetical protein [Desulfovibrio sp.]
TAFAKVDFLSLAEGQGNTRPKSCEAQALRLERRAREKQFYQKLTICQECLSHKAKPRKERRALRLA